MAKFYKHPPGVVYLNSFGFPTIVLRSDLSQESFGGEIIGLLEGKSLVAPTFESHLPCGEMSISSLGHKMAAEIAKRKRHLRQALSSIEIEQDSESTITHPFNGNFFVLSYSL